MLTAEIIEELADRLEAAETDRTPMRHFTLDHPGMTIEDGYAVQARWVQQKIARGAGVRGHKIGLTSKVMQEGAGIHEPDYGVLLDYMFYEAGSAIPMDQFIAPRVEVELCFQMGKPLSGPNCTIFDVLEATEYVIPALEIIDTRFHRFDPVTNSPRKIMDTVADNAANGAVVLGGRPVRPLDVDLRWVSALLLCNETVVESGVAAAVLNHPANGIAWLANKLWQHGETLQAGEILLAGSFTRSVPVSAGEVYHCDYGPLGSISCRFA
ncbi:2-oxo-hepta-3-ene-1,7-dioic acid hydratase [Streptomyces sp. NBC_00988]|uniref:2-oxo-hept-4-ene-1,7-dioate hydratase n=1 Tax=Streptomyces sp. NBC_00988 TaxID=2903704 RepID=UPI00386D1DD2|nr:2-oxo-hepta-3-ene-1,7-dioic acid hydratase [Streptomyces sp. NBC_00988]